MFPQMNSLGKSSKWPSYDSLPSTSSFPPSEDEADIFSEGEGDGVLKSSLNSKFNGDQCELYPEEARHLSPEVAALRSSTPGDLTFAKKVSTVSLKQALSFWCFIFITNASVYIFSVLICTAISALCWGFYKD